ncbi:hypothetical protein [Flammeovirga aprica]|uniref:Uncharacterized protein n=1 Tax=Flammeovirga aprica JL-4 TaxID=694437 RepID=A0A7X9XBY7_9BACT|nr:hypothetical protein [Flammeovirga aprica]NME71084.1 hypothetical protein [Flammeovirga aprica JL-4]
MISSLKKTKWVIEVNEDILSIQKNKEEPTHFKKDAISHIYMVEDMNDEKEEQSLYDNNIQILEVNNKTTNLFSSYPLIPYKKIVQLATELREALDIKTTIIDDDSNNKYIFDANTYFIQNINQLFATYEKINLYQLATFSIKKDKLLPTEFKLSNIFEIIDIQHQLGKEKTSIRFITKGTEEKKIFQLEESDEKVSWYEIKQLKIEDFFDHNNHSIEYLPSEMEYRGYKGEMSALKAYQMDSCISDSKTNLVERVLNLKKSKHRLHFVGFDSEENKIKSIEDYEYLIFNDVMIEYKFTAPLSEEFNIKKRKIRLEELPTFITEEYNSYTLKALNLDAGSLADLQMILAFNPSNYINNEVSWNTYHCSVGDLFSCVDQESFIVEIVYCHLSISRQISFVLRCQNENSTQLFAIDHNGKTHSITTLNSFQFIDENGLSDLSIESFPTTLIHNNEEFYKQNLVIKKQMELTNSNEPKFLFEVQYFNKNESASIQIKKYDATDYIEITYLEELKQKPTFLKTEKLEVR